MHSAVVFLRVVCASSRTECRWMRDWSQIASIRIKTFVLKSCLNLLRIFGKLLLIINRLMDATDGRLTVAKTDYWINMTQARVRGEPQLYCSDIHFLVPSEIINSERVLIMFNMYHRICQYLSQNWKIFLEAVFPSHHPLPGSRHGLPNNEPLMMSRSFKKRIQSMDRRPQEIIC